MLTSEQKKKKNLVGRWCGRGPRGRGYMHTKIVIIKFYFIFF